MIINGYFLTNQFFKAILGFMVMLSTFLSVALSGALTSLINTNIYVLSSIQILIAFIFLYLFIYFAVDFLCITMIQMFYEDRGIETNVIKNNKYRFIRCLIVCIASAIYMGIGFYGNMFMSTGLGFFISYMYGMATVKFYFEDERITLKEEF